MLWRCFLAARTGRPIRVEGKRNAATYRDVITCSKELWIWRGVSCALTFALTIKNVLFLTSHRVTHRSWQNIYACVRTDSSVSWVSSGRHFDTFEAEYGPQMSSLFTVSITVESCFGHQGCESVTRLKTEEMAHFNVCTTQANFYDHYLTVVVAAELFWPLTFLLKLFSAVNVNYFSQWGRDWVLVCLSAGGGKHSTVCLNIVDNFNSRWPEYQIISSVNNQSAATCHQSRVPQPWHGWERTTLYFINMDLKE